MRCRVKYACGHSGVVYLDGPMERIYRRMDLFSHMRCRDCVDADGTKLVTMPYRQYRNDFAVCRTKADSYDPDAKTICVYVPEDYEANGSTGADYRSEEVRAAIAVLRKSGALTAEAAAALSVAEMLILDYLRKYPMVSAYTAACTCHLALPERNLNSNDALNCAYAALCCALE